MRPNACCDRHRGLCLCWGNRARPRAAPRCFRTGRLKYPGTLTAWRRAALPVRSGRLCAPGAVPGCSAPHGGAYGASRAALSPNGSTAGSSPSCAAQGRSHNRLILSNQMLNCRKPRSVGLKTRRLRLGFLANCFKTLMISSFRSPRAHRSVREMDRDRREHLISTTMPAPHRLELEIACVRLRTILASGAAMPCRCRRLLSSPRAGDLRNAQPRYPVRTYRVPQHPHAGVAPLPKPDPGRHLSRQAGSSGLLSRAAVRHGGELTCIYPRRFRAPQPISERDIALIRRARRRLDRANGDRQRRLSRSTLRALASKRSAGPPSRPGRETDWGRRQDSPSAAYF